MQVAELLGDPAPVLGWLCVVHAAELERDQPVLVGDVVDVERAWVRRACSHRLGRARGGVPDGCPLVRSRLQAATHEGHGAAPLSVLSSLRLVSGPELHVHLVGHAAFDAAEAMGLDHLIEGSSCEITPSEAFELLDIEPQDPVEAFRSALAVELLGHSAQ